MNLLPSCYAHTLRFGTAHPHVKPTCLRRGKKREKSEEKLDTAELQRNQGRGGQLKKRS